MPDLLKIISSDIDRLNDRCMELYGHTKDVSSADSTDIVFAIKVYSDCIGLLSNAKHLIKELENEEG